MRRKANLINAAIRLDRRQITFTYFHEMKTARRPSLGAPPRSHGATAYDAGKGLERNERRLPDKTKLVHVPAAASLQPPPRRSPAPAHRPVPDQWRQPPGHPARPRRHALRPPLRRRQPPPAAGCPRVPLIPMMGPFAGPSTRHPCRRPGESRDPASKAFKAGFRPAPERRYLACASNTFLDKLEFRSEGCKEICQERC
jgi:hypothetical protein